MDQSGQGTPPPGEQPPADQAPPPPPQGWQSSPQQPAPPPAGSGAPSWTSNLTAQGTIPGPAGSALADVPNRIIAAVIDFIILGIIGFIVQSIMTSVLGENLGGIFIDIRVPSLLSSLATVAVMAVVSAGYFIYMWLKMDGATLGMRVLKLRVRDAASGGPITQQQAINRWLMLGAPYAASFLFAWTLGILVSLAVLAWYIYLLVTTAQSATRQGFHDQYAKTIVSKG